MEFLQQMVPLIAAAAAGSLLASVWQGLLICLLVALCLRLVPELSPATRSVVWMAVLLLVLCLPVLALIVPHARVGRGEIVSARLGWGAGLAAVWGLLSFVRAVQLAGNAVRLRGIARRAAPVEVAGEVSALLEGGARTARLCTSTEVNRPCVAGFLRPRILIAPDLLEALTASELEQILLHETEHLRRWDDWTNLLQQISLVLLPLNPVLHWIDRKLCVERELACDDGVLRVTHARKEYAACLVRLAEDSLMRRGVSLALGALGTRVRESELVRRVRRILSVHAPALDGRRAQWATGALLAGVVATGGLLASGPQLIGFEASPATAAQSIGAVAAVRKPALSEGLLPGARPTMVRAGMAPAVSPAAMVRVRAAVSRRKPERRSVRAAVTAGSQRWVEQTVWRVQTVRTPVTLTRFEVAEPVYAAVPWRDGWLIVQL